MEDVVNEVEEESDGGGLHREGQRSVLQIPREEHDDLLNFE